MVQNTIRIALVTILLSLSCESKAAGRQPAEPMQFELVGNGGNCADCEWINAEGVITAETPARFMAYLAREGDAPFRIHFNSAGGDLGAAIELGRLIHARDHLITEVRGTQKSTQGDWYESTPGVCYDACVFAFLGGAQRFVDPKSRVGISNAGTKATTTPQSQSTASPSGNKKRILSYLGDLGFSSQVLLKTLSAAKPIPKDFARSDIVSWEIDNSSQAQGFSAWAVSDAEDRPALVTKSEDLRSSVKLHCRPDGTSGPPKIYASFIQTFRAGYVAEQLENIRDSLESIWITVAGRAMLVDGQELHIFSMGDDLVVRVALPHELGRQLTVAGATLFVKPDGMPDAYRDVLSSPNTDNPLAIDTELMRLLSKDCAG